MNGLTITTADKHQKEEIVRFLKNNEFSSPYHYIEWMEAIKEAYGHDYSYFVARQEDTIVGVLPTCKFRTLSGRMVGCSIPFCDVGGPVAVSEEVRLALIDRALGQLDFKKSGYLELRQRQTSQDSGADLTNRKVSMLLDLPRDAEMLMQGFKAKLRSQINKAGKNGLVFDCANDRRSIDEFFSVYCVNMHMLGSPTHSRNWFHSLRKAFQEKLLVGRIWYGGDCIAAGILLFGSKSVAIPWASTLRKYNRLAPNMLLYWNLLRISCDRGYEIFDFGRSTFGEGTYQFKKQWGARPVTLEWSRLGRNGLDVELSTATSGNARVIVAAVWRKIPLFVANVLGPWLRKHISL